MLERLEWGAKPTVVRTSAQALYFSTSENDCLVWCRSVGPKKINIGLNETCRIIKGCIHTPGLHLYKAAGFTSPDSCRKAREHTEKLKQTFDGCHSIYRQECAPRKLKSRRGFLSHALDKLPFHYPLTKDPPNGVSSDCRAWKMLNRIGTGVAPVNSNLIKMGFSGQKWRQMGPRRLSGHGTPSSMPCLLQQMYSRRTMVSGTGGIGCSPILR